MINREAIFAALFATVAGVPGLKTTSRKLLHWSDVSPADQPALFLTQGRETASAPYRQPTKWTLRASLYLYAHQNSLDVLPSTALNELIDAVELALAPGPDGEQTLGLVAQTPPFKRAGPATYTDVNGVVQTAPADVLRNAPYVGGVLQTPLVEPASTNSTKWCRDFTNPVWTANAGTHTVAQDAVGLDGTANSATTIIDTDVAQQSLGAFQIVTIPNDTATHCVQAWVRKDAVTTRFPALRIRLVAPTVADITIVLNTQTGAFVAGSSAIGVGTRRVIDAGLWWIMEITVTNTAGGATSLEQRFYPAWNDTGGAGIVGTALGGCVLGLIQTELNKNVSSSPIFTTAAAVSRAADIDQLFAATATGYSRQIGSFISDDFTVGMKITPVGFTSNLDTTIQSVTDLAIATEPPPPQLDPALAGRSLSFGLPIGSGKVSHCRIVGEIETDEGVLGDQAVAIIPIEIMANA